MEVSRQDILRIADLAKSAMQHQPHRLYWDHDEATHGDKVVMCYLKAINTVLGTDFNVDINKEQL